jgi:hypothetical protein
VHDQDDIFALISSKYSGEDHTRWYAIGSALAALEMKEFDDEVPPVPSYLNLSKLGTLLGPALPHLVQAFSPENRVRTEFKLQRIAEGSWKELEHRFSLKQPS